MSNIYVGGFGTVRFRRSIGGRVLIADFDTRGFLKLVSHGDIRTNLVWDKKQRLYGFYGTAKNMVENHSSDTSGELIKLLNMISDCIHTTGTDNRTITMIPSYSSDADAVNTPYEVAIALGTTIGAIDELTKIVESVQYWEFNWTVLNNITTLPTGLTLLTEEHMIGDDGETLIGDDGEVLIGG